MDSQKVDFRERVIEIKDLRKVINDLLRVFQGKSALFRKAPGCVNPDWQSASPRIFAVGEIFDILEISTGPRQKLQNDISHMAPELAAWSHRRTYVLIFGTVTKETVLSPFPKDFDSFTGWLDSAVRFSGSVIVKS